MAGSNEAARIDCSQLCLSDRVRKWIDVINYGLAVLLGIYGAGYEAGVFPGVSFVKPAVSADLGQALERRLQACDTEELRGSCAELVEILKMQSPEPDGRPIVWLAIGLGGFSVALNVAVGFSNRRYEIRNYYCGPECGDQNGPNGKIVQVTG